ncbi:hypothetical protein [Parageobacillus thermoglucosidasius]|uniref:hypothetical protein n=1 Tax=Parageobacillus thermoglucosidasius TaxID=1426 RepID=UPI00162A34AD|nr:hypothetical protein [Parageobacillus thermoglucosidasius]MED4904131.1 hypothetical protein [Parageobacillus thermoglucosidasius]MED4915681.1 hypothetical protein [Parageobacillus thermoglucosidasius]
MTGERIEIPYTKAPAPVRGLVKLELFDDLTGKKIEEIKSENFISKYVHLYWEQLMRRSFIYHLNSQQGNLSGFSSLLDFPFNTFWLLDYNKPEDPENERIAPGKVVGYATRYTYSGSDTKRGSINLAESFANAEQIHYVFDFPTHAANGTFQSLIWSSAVEDSYIMWPYVRYTTFSGSGFIMRSSGIAITDTEVFIRSEEDDKVRVYDKNTFKGASSQPKREFYLQYSNVLAMCYAMGYLWTVSYQDGKIRKVDPQNGTTLETITPNGGPSSLSGITFDGVDFWVTDSTYSSTPQALVFRVGLDGTIKQAWQDTYRRYWDIAYIPEYDLFMLADGASNSGMTIRNRNGEFICMFRTTFLIGYYHAVDYKNGEVWHTNLNNDITKQINGGLAARTLLPSAVTKTNMNTMKVTYDFILPPYNPLYV